MRIKDLRIGTRLGGGFVIVVALTMVLGLVAVLQMRKIAGYAQEIYDHPLVVSNAAWDIKANVFAMHVLMTNIALSRDAVAIEDQQREIDEREKKVEQSFERVFDRFLGDMRDVEKARQDFLDWKPTLNEVIRLSRRGEHEKAIEISRDRGEKQVKLLEASIKVMVDFAGGKAESFVAGARETSEKTMSMMAFLLTAVLVLSGGIALVITTSITRPLKNLFREINIITSGKLNSRIDIESRDEIGELADSLRTMQEKLQRTAAVAEQISQGNFRQEVEVSGPEDSVALSINRIIRNFNEVVRYALMIANGDYRFDMEPKSGDDQLGHALNLMADSLKEVVEKAKQVASGDYSGRIEPKSAQDELSVALNEMTSSLRIETARNARQMWLRAGLNKLNEAMRGDLDIGTLSQKTVTFMAKYLEAPIGALYLADNEAGSLKLTGAYAFSTEEGRKDTFRFGEGLVGQAALEMEIISVTNIPEDYVRIASGLGDGLPFHIVVAPFINQGEVTGVLELGSFHEFSDTQMDFLDFVLENIAINFNSGRSREKIKELLVETRHQAEMLQTQTEELQQTNEELEEQTQALKESETHLLTQQEELRAVNEELEERSEELILQGKAIRDKNLHLLETQKQLEQKARDLELTGRYKSEFLANMSHELRTPLNSILLLSRLLAENRDNTLTAKQMEFARTISNSGTELLNLINEILDLSKIEAGKIVLHVEDVSIRDFFEHTLAAFRQMAADKGLQFPVHIADGLPAVMRTDAQRVIQVLNNLLANAFKFTEQGEISLTISRPPAQVNLSRSKLAATATIAFAVADTGIGVPAEKQAVIFEAFQQADGTTSRRYGGTGLGLSISRELAYLLGGELQMESEPGKGSTFTLYLPESYAGSPPCAARPEDGKEGGAATAAIPAAAEKIAAENFVKDDRRNIGKGEKLVLIIEDDRRFSQALQDLAHARGLKCLVAEDGKTGLHYADYHKPGAIILDIGLPGDMDGWEVMERLKENLETRHIPVHFITATDRSFEAMKMGAIGYLTKPVTLEGLQGAFAEIERNIAGTVKKLLIVEDDDVERKSIMEFIGTNDVVTSAAKTAEEAYALLKREKFDCVILDLRLGGMSGFDLLAKISADREISKPPFIVYTGKDLSEDEERELSRYAESIIVKGARSPERLLAETTLFLHRVQANLPKDSQRLLRMEHGKEAVLKGKKILVVDDDMRNVFAITSILEEKGLRVIAARNGREGLEKLAQNEDVDLVLMDIMMPEMDGYEAMKRIRSQKKYGRLPIIALTAKAMMGDRAKCLEAGASEYLAKPVDTEKMLSLLRVWLYR